MKVLGVDPGTHCMGWGFIEGDARNFSSFRFGVIKPGRGGKLPERLAFIYRELKKIIGECSPDVVSCEDPFFFRDARAALNLGRAWAAAAIAASEKKIPFETYSPLEIKKSTAGYGRASKEQIARQVKRLLRIKDDIPADAADALACAFCYLTDRRNYPRGDSAK